MICWATLGKASHIFGSRYRGIYVMMMTATTDSFYKHLLRSIFGIFRILYHIKLGDWPENCMFTWEAALGFPVAVYTGDNLFLVIYGTTAKMTEKMMMRLKTE
eukprot:scaffold25949_cov137-Cylindrotheca_fusiformis.AAC.2